MVAQILADALQLVQRLDAKGAQAVGLADAGELEQLGRVDRAARDDDFARSPRFPLHPADGVADADATPSFQDQRLGQRPLLDRQVRPRAGRVEIAVGRALAAALGDRHLRHADAFLGLAVLVGIEGQADLFRRRDHLLQERHLVARRVGDAQQSVAAAEPVGAALVALHALEDRQHVLVAPAAIAELGPVVVVLGLAADIDHAVDRARAAQHLAAGNFDAPAARALVRLRRVAPVDGGIVDHLGDADRHARPEEVRALGPGLEQQHPMGAALGQPAGDHRPGRTGTDDDVVIGLVARHGVRPPPRGRRKPAPGRPGKGTPRDRPRPASPGDDAR